jgi:hypothetical protein
MDEANEKLAKAEKNEEMEAAQKLLRDNWKIGNLVGTKMEIDEESSIGMSPSGSSLNGSCVEVPEVIIIEKEQDKKENGNA